MLSIIIQAKNEEKYLPSLLGSIKKQDFQEKYEVILAYADSTDKTKQIAKNFGCGIINVGNHANGVNKGAAAAKSDVILFLDADTVLTRNFLSINYSKFVKRRLDFAVCPFSSTSRKMIDVLMNEVTKYSMLLAFRFRPYITGFCFMARKSKFFELGGFNESVKWFDDLAFSNKLTKNVRLGVLPAKVNVSHRRAERVGRLKLGMINSVLAFYRLIGKDYNGTY